jgi:hypothetical protein
MVYQYSWDLCLFINDNTRGSCTMRNLIFSALSVSTAIRLSVNSGQDTETQSTGLHDPLNLLLWIFGYRGTLKNFVVFRADQGFRGIRATSREYLSGDWSKTRNSCQRWHLCEAKSWKLLKCIGTTQSMRCRDHKNIAHVSADIGLWTYVDWDFFVNLSSIQP